jgi:hypothetical protein
MKQTHFRLPPRAIGALQGIKPDGKTYRTKLTAADWSVLAAISLHADEAGRSYPGLTRIEELTGILHRHVVRSIKRLKEVGLLRSTRVKRGDGWTNNVYEVVFDPMPGVPSVGNPQYWEYPILGIPSAGNSLRCPTNRTLPRGLGGDDSADPEVPDDFVYDDLAEAGDE